MAKVFGVWPVELADGVLGEDFEKFWLEEYGPLGLKLGWISHVCKADRGERNGKYAVIWEIPSVERRNRFAPEQDKFSDELIQLLGPEFDILNKKLDKLITGAPSTDYVELSR